MKERMPAGKIRVNATVQKINNFALQKKHKN